MGGTADTPETGKTRNFHRFCDSSEFVDETDS